jgi:hypothetical protein
VVGKKESKRAKAEEVETPPDLMEVLGRTSNPLTTRGWHGGIGQGST